MARIDDESAGFDEWTGTANTSHGDLPSSGGLAVPATRAQARVPAGSALFEQGELDQLQSLQARSSLLLCSPAPPQLDGNSTSSSTNLQILQAEVQRQLEEYGQRQRLEMQRLRQEIFNLRAGRDTLQERLRLAGGASVFGAAMGLSNSAGLL